VMAAQINYQLLIKKLLKHRGSLRLAVPIGSSPFYCNRMPTPKLPAAERYFHEATARLQGLLDNQREALDRAAELGTEAIAAEGLVHLFGCGHSRMMCEEMTPRQGCFVGWHTIVELGLTYHNLIVGPNGLRQSLHLEKTSGYAEQILRNFAFGP